jgi:hypothetical protein
MVNLTKHLPIPQQYKSFPLKTPQTRLNGGRFPRKFQVGELSNQLTCVEQKLELRSPGNR